MILFWALIAAAVFLLAKSRKIRVTVLVLAILLGLYDLLLTFTPVYLPNQNDEAAFSRNVVEAYLNYHRYSLTGMLEDFHINSANRVTYDGIEYVKTSFDVKPRIKSMDYGGWLVGNGVAGEDSWVLDKAVFFQYGKLGNLYFIVDECSLPS